MTTNCEAALIKLKTNISNQVLKTYLAGDPNPADIARALLSHFVDEIKHPIQFVSKSLSQSESN